MGSSAAHRSPSFAVCQPTTSSVIDRGEEPAPAVALGVEAGGIGPLHHITSGRSVVIVLSWAGLPLGGPRRRGAKSPCVRISRRTRWPPTGSPRWARPARTFRWPSSWKGQAAGTAGVPSTTSASSCVVFGPGLFPRPRELGDSSAAYTLDRGTRYTAQIMVSG